MDNTEAVEKLAEIIADQVYYENGTYLIDESPTAQAVLATIQADPLAFMEPDSREAACVSALAGISDPEAFIKNANDTKWALDRIMSYVEEIKPALPVDAQQSLDRTFQIIREHLKGGAE